MQSDIHCDLMARCRVTDAIFGATSHSFCVNQSSGNITELPEYKTHLLEICLNLLWNRMGKNMPGLGSGFGNSCAEQGSVGHVNELFSETPAGPLGVGSIGFCPAVLALWLLCEWILGSGVSISWDLPLCRLVGSSLCACDFTTAKTCRFRCL